VEFEYLRLYHTAKIKRLIAVILAITYEIQLPGMYGKFQQFVAQVTLRKHIQLNNVYQLIKEV